MGALIFIVPMLVNGLLWGLSAPGVRKLSAAARSLDRALPGPGSAADRIRALQESRARAVDDSAARLRGIERDLHDGLADALTTLAARSAVPVELLAERIRTVDGRLDIDSPPGRPAVVPVELPSHA